MSSSTDYGTLHYKSKVQGTPAQRARGLYGIHFLLLSLIFALTTAASTIYGNQVQSSPPPNVISNELAYAGVSSALSFIFIFVSIAYINYNVQHKSWALGIVTALVLIVDVIIIVLTSLGAAALQNVYTTTKALNSVYGLFVASAILAIIDFVVVAYLVRNLSIKTDFYKV